MFRTKICGVTTASDAQMIARAGADAIGLNFYENSKRYLAPEKCPVITAVLPRTVKRVGVFVNASTDFIREMAHAWSLDYVQLHGDEPPEILGQLKELQVIRAFRCDRGLAPVRDYLDECEVQPAAVLVDAYDPHEFGGTGKTLHWPELANASKFIGDLPLILAGGLRASNVAEAIRLAQPFGVDTASGVEISPGIKDPTQCQAFIVAANSAFFA